MVKCSFFAVWLVVAGFANAGEGQRLTTDGRIKRDTAFVDSSGKALLYSVLEKPTQLRLMRLSLPEGKAEAVHPSETRSEFEPAASADGRFVTFVQNRGNLSLALVIEDLQGTQSAEVPPGGF